MTNWFNAGLFLLLACVSWLFSKLMIWMANEFWRPKTVKFWQRVNLACQLVMLAICCGFAFFFMKS